MLRIGLTGGIGSGKSTASNFFEAFGSFVINADEEAKKLISSNETVQHELSQSLELILLMYQDK